MRADFKQTVGTILGLTSVAGALAAAAYLLEAGENVSRGAFQGTWLSVIGLSVASGIALIAAFLQISEKRMRTAREHARRIFFIYAREDAAKARQLADWLRDAGFEPWLDVEQILPGQMWRRATSEALEGSAAALVLISKDFAQKEYARLELKHALEVLQSRKEDSSPILPVRLDDSEVPDLLKDIQWVDLRTEGGKKKLVEGLTYGIGLGASLPTSATA
ncbi:MAG TPA: toll/interleukin-1 receptor domain-containing protein [Acetobacteraceae bacterium]|jgi:hypothetical protein